MLQFELLFSDDEFEDAARHMGLVRDCFRNPSEFEAELPLLTLYVDHFSIHENLKIFSVNRSVVFKKKVR